MCAGIEIHTIRLAMLLGMGGVNCYLVAGSAGFVLVDTGGVSNRRALAGELARLGCAAGALRLILLTHGDFDHSGNAAHLRAALGAPIGMGAGDAQMAARGDMFAGREKQPGWLLRLLMPLFAPFGPRERFTPDALLGEGDSLAEYELDARVLALPGHSRGSLGLLTADGALFCGDLLENSGKRPALNALMDDPAAGAESLRRLRALTPRVVYPGHGPAFELGEVEANS